jgi:hypothetical protein
MNMVNLINDNLRIQGWALGHKKYWQKANGKPNNKMDDK